MVSKCSGITQKGKPCRGVPVYDSQWCMTHHPDLQERQSENRRAGGAARSNARRAAKQWAAFGKEMGDADLPAILKSCMYAVRDKSMSPGEAGAIATLARTSVQITGDLEHEARITELEKAAGISTRPTPIRRQSS